MPELKARHVQVLESLIDVLGLRIERAREQNDFREVERLEESRDYYRRDLEALQTRTDIS